MLLSRFSITTKLLLLFLMVGLSSVMIVGIYSFYSARRAIMNRTLDQLISVRAIKKQQLEYFFSEKIKNIEQLSRKVNFGKEDYLPYGFSNLFLATENGDGLKEIESPCADFPVRNSLLIPQIHRLVKEVRRNNEVVVTDLFYPSAQDSMPVCLIGCRLFSIDSLHSKVLILMIPASEINHIMLQDNSRIGLGHSGEAYLVGSDFLMRSESRFLKGSLLHTPVKSETVLMAIEGKTGFSLTRDYRDIPVFSAYEPFEITGLKWVVLAEIDYQEAMVPVEGLRNDILLVSLVISVFILGFAQLISKMITQPIIHLKEAATRLGQGDFDHKVAVHSKDEIGALAWTFNRMSEQIREERRKSILALFDGQEMERRRLSRELHDGLGQQLVGTKLQIENCNENDPDCLKKAMMETKSDLHHIVDELKRISNDMMPAALDELGLVTALRNLCNDLNHHLKMEIDFDADLSCSPDSKSAIYLFRIAQEGIHNIIKHAKAKRIALQLIDNQDHFILILEDDGIGFNPFDTVAGNGLSNMKERALLLGGTFSLESEPGHGTTLRRKIPKKC